MTSDKPSISTRRWLILAIAAIAQLMVFLDVTIINIALPSAQDGRCDLRCRRRQRSAVGLLLGGAPTEHLSWR
jgi:hypothetical protein